MYPSIPLSFIVNAILILSLRVDVLESKKQEALDTVGGLWGGVDDLGSKTQDAVGGFWGGGQNGGPGSFERGGQNGGPGSDEPGGQDRGYSLF